LQQYNEVFDGGKAVQNTAKLHNTVMKIGIFFPPETPREKSGSRGATGEDL